MASVRRRVVVLGSTGSIGTNCLEVIDKLNDRLEVLGLSAHANWKTLFEQARSCRPRWVTITGTDAARQADRTRLDHATRLLSGPEGIVTMVTDPDVDVVVSAIVGAAGLTGTWAALEAGKTVAVANKETLVMAGQLVMELAGRRGASILPVDSEHSAIFQALQGEEDRKSKIENRKSKIEDREGHPPSSILHPPSSILHPPSSISHSVERVVLTASGGPFRGRSAAELQNVTAAEALCHPTWRMGPKITVDSATLMNKALEIIEAHWLFGLPPERIDVIIHPESVIHSFVEFIDGSILAQLSPPDMRLPIQYALTYPQRVAGPARRLNWRELAAWHFEQPDHETFPALQLGYEVARRGGTCGAVLNAANEAAVSRFLAGELSFLDITRACREVLANHNYSPRPTLAELTAIDRWRERR